MDTTLLIARFLLAGVFALAGTAKLADRKGSEQAIIGFGVPPSLAAMLGILLPAAELFVAAALIPVSTALWGAFGAFALLVLFVAGIGANLARGRRPACQCFGQLHSAPAGWKTLTRNVALAALAGFVVWQGWNRNVGPSVLGWHGPLSGIQLQFVGGGLVVLALLAVQWWFLLHLLRQNGRLLLHLEAIANDATSDIAPTTQDGGPAQFREGLPVGAIAPSFGLEDLNDETLTLDSLRAIGKPVMLLFSDPGCGPCNTLLPEVGRWQQEHADKLSIALVSRGTPDENRAKASELGLSKVLLQKDWEISEAFEVRGTPSAVMVRPDGTIGSGVAGGSEAIQSLVRQAVEGPARVAAVPGAPASAAAAPNGNGHGPCPKCGKQHPAESVPAMPAALKVGDAAPEIKLKDLSGKEIVLEEDFADEETLVLFWNPGCGFCQQMLPDIKEWEQNIPEDAPRLLFVSAGTEEANREMGLSSTLVLDQGFTVGRSFGASGTPSAVLVDAEGKVASEVAVGAPTIRELAGADWIKA